MLAVPYIEWVEGGSSHFLHFLMAANVRSFSIAQFYCDLKCMIIISLCSGNECVYMGVYAYILCAYV